MNGYEGHNLLTYLYAKNIYGWMKEICEKRGELPLLWGRSGYAGSHTIPAAWAGDSSSDKATHSAILQAGLGMAMSGVSFWGYDLGGFYHTGYTGNEERPDAFLCTDGTLDALIQSTWQNTERALAVWGSCPGKSERMDQFQTSSCSISLSYSLPEPSFRHSDASSVGNGISKGSDGEDAESVVYAGRFLIDLARL